MRPDGVDTSMKLSDDQRRILAVIANPEEGKLAWTQRNTRDDAVAERMKNMGLIVEAGKSATGRYWQVTAAGLEERKL